jgi:hypothetical protein
LTTAYAHRFKQELETKEIRNYGHYSSFGRTNLIFHSEVDDASRFTSTIDRADEKLTVL